MKFLKKFSNFKLSAFKEYLQFGSGGIGKSRLAFEVCKDLQNSGYYAGFIDNIEGFQKWDTWQPEQPTLLIDELSCKESYFLLFKE